MSEKITLSFEDATKEYLPAAMKIRFGGISEKDLRVITSFLKRQIDFNGWDVGFNEKEKSITLPCSPVGVFSTVVEQLLNDLKSHSIEGLPSTHDMNESIRTAKKELFNSKDRIEIRRSPRDDIFRIEYIINSGQTKGVDEGWKKASEKAFGKPLSTTCLYLNEKGILDKVHKFFKQIKDEKIFSDELTESIDPETAVSTVHQIKHLYQWFTEQQVLKSAFDTVQKQ